MHSDSLIIPDWQAPDTIRTLSTTRLGGFSQPPYNSLNMGTHVGDTLSIVSRNREHLTQLGNVPDQPLWLNQIHGTEVIHASHWHADVDADAIYSDQTAQVCAIITADCLPVLFTDKHGQQVAAAHAGWRGLLHGVLENTVNQFKGLNRDILVWLGPAIGPEQFEVGKDVYEAFIAHSPQAREAFVAINNTHYLADIYQLAKQRLSALGITQISGGNFCTASDNDRFFSYRRDGVTGRMASLIWISPK